MTIKQLHDTILVKTHRGDEMNKLTAMLIFFLLIISIPLTAFVSAAEKGNVQDTAHIFPEDKIKEINLTALHQDSNITFYILTVDTLNGKSSEEYANEVFNTWGLDESDTLILISKKERRFEVNFKNPEFLANLNNLSQDYDTDSNTSETKLEELIGKHFIPYAQKEDFASGVIDFMNTFRQVNSGNFSIKEQSEVDSNSDNGEGPTIKRDSINTTTVTNTLFVFAAFIAAAILTWLVTKRAAQKSDVMNLKIEIQTFMEIIKSTQDDTKELITNYKGSVQFDLNSIGKNLNSFSSQVSMLLSDLDNLEIPFFKKNAYKTNIREKKFSFALIESSFSNFKYQITTLLELEQEIREFSEKINTKLENLQESINNLPVKMRNLKHQDYYDIRREFEKTQYYRMYDIETIDSKLKIIDKELDSLKVQINRIPELYQELQNATQRISKFKGHVDRLLSENSLKLSEFNPYANISAAEQSLRLFEQSFCEGNIEDSFRYSQDITARLRAAIDEIQERISLKQQIVKGLESIEKINSNITLTDEHFYDKYSKVKDFLAEKHWLYMPSEYQTKLSELQTLQLDISKIKELSSDEVQKYQEANELVKHVLTKLSAIDNTFENIQNADYVFTKRIQSAQKELDTWSIRFREASEKARKNAIQIYSVSGLSAILERCSVQKDSLEKLTKIKPFDLELIELEVSQFISNVKNAENAIEQLIEEKKITERKLEEVQHRIRRAKNRRNNSSRSGVTSSVNDINHIKQLLLLGAFSEAINKLSEVERNIDRMEPGKSPSYNNNTTYSQTDNYNNYSNDRHNYHIPSSSGDSSSNSGSDGGNISGGDNW